MSELSQSSRIRTPIKGLRQKLRTALRAAGYEGKFSTGIHRDGRLVVIGANLAELPFKEFEGRLITFVKV